jgi:hypothetical protein
MSERAERPKRCLVGTRRTARKYFLNPWDLKSAMPSTMRTLRSCLLLSVAVVAALAALAALLLALPALFSLLPIHSATENAADTSGGVTVFRGRRSIYSRVFLTTDSIGALFCGDSVVECMAWTNRLFPLRWVR